MHRASVPKFILKKIDSLIANFIWAFSADKRKRNLEKLEDLTRPKKAGGWGLKDIQCFVWALTIRTLWHVIGKEDI